MIYKCKCEKCGTVVEINTKTDKIGLNYDTNVTAYGYLTTPCTKCKGSAYAPWFGKEGERCYTTRV